MGLLMCWLLFARGSPGCAMCSLTAAMQVINCDPLSSAWAIGQSSRRPAQLHHQAIGQGQRLRGATASVGCRANLRMARPLPTPGKGLGKVHRVFNHLGTDRFNPHAHAQNRKILLELRKF